MRVGFISGSAGLKKVSREAFTLIEVIASAAILMLGITFVSRTFVRTVRQRASLNLRQEARLLASSKTEEAFAGAPPGEGRSSANENIHWKRSVRQSSVPGMLEVEVEVSWHERGRRREIVLKTLLRGR